MKTNTGPKKSIIGAGHKARIAGLDWSPDGRHVASTDWKGWLFLWKPWEKEPTHQTQLTLQGLGSILWFLDSKRIVVGGCSGIEIWDTQSQNWVRSASLPNVCGQSCASRPMSVGLASTAQTRSFASGTSSTQTLSSNTLLMADMYCGFDFSSDSSQIILVEGKDRRVSCRVLSDGKLSWQLPSKWSASALTVRDELFALVSSETKEKSSPVQLYSCKTGEKVQSFATFLLQPRELLS